MYSFFSGFEDNHSLQMAVIGAEKGNPLVQLWLYYYLDGNNFNFNNLKFITNTQIITNIMVERGLVLNNQIQEIEPNCVIFPKDYFSPKDPGTRLINPSKNTYTIHHFLASWVSPNYKLLLRISWGIKRFIYFIENSIGLKTHASKPLRSIYRKLNGKLYE